MIGVAKAYVTRVGEGPFPTEIEGPEQERVREIGARVRDRDRDANRRCGWLDLVALRYAVRVNGIDRLALTKLDVLSPLRRAARVHPLPAARRRGDRELPGAPERLPHARGRCYETLPGWEEPLDACASVEELPDAARRYVEFVEQELDVEVTLVGTGADREAVLTRA